tara:strand:+ start:4542 stop:5315 length:774 start_codon:yes stop_codon:yes gene_type:complete
MSRLFTFGCSYTHFYWPTHADLLGEQFDQLHNWGLSGLGNRAICERLSECIMHNQFNDDDLIIVQWTDFHRYDWHDPKNFGDFCNWRTGGNIWSKPVEIEWIKDTWNEFSYTLHSMNFIHLGNALTRQLPCKVYHTSMIDYKPILTNTPFEKYLSVIDSNWILDFTTFCEQNNYKGVEHRQSYFDEIVKNKVPKVFIDRHPTSDLYIKWIEEVMKIKIDNPLADRVKKCDWSTIDTVSGEIYDKLQWYGKKNFVKGL